MNEKSDIVMRSKPASLEREIQQIHQVKLSLCERLEAIADSLPDDIDNQECLVISRTLLPVFKESHQLEESELFPLVIEYGFADAAIDKTIERLKFEHLEDESFADEISSCLQDLVTHPHTANINQLSYMLRGFFKGVQRHIAFEREYILPLLS